ncbi:MAG: VOC family protein [Acidobacteria bacterium]|nr:VOC family protein [Acidobacteriota bacterium]
MSTQVKPIPEGFHSITPHIVVQNAKQAIEFYQKAFNAEVLGCMPGPDGEKIMHAELRIGNSPLMLCDEFPEMGSLSPVSRGGTSVTMHLYVEKADETYNQAVEAGAKVVMPLADMFWGDRYGIVSDPFGHHWAIATHVQDLSFEEIAAAGAAAMASGGCQ